MKCSHCGFENRGGVKFCEDCGQPLQEVSNAACPACGASSRPGMRFCEQCGASLTGLNSQVPPLPVQPIQQSAPVQPVIVQIEGAAKKRRFNPLLLLALLLLILATLCCCLLMVARFVNPPALVMPVIEKLRDFAPLHELPAINAPKQNPEGECQAEKEKLNKVDTSGIVTCAPAINQCWTELAGLDDYSDVELHYGWNGNVQGMAKCTPNFLNGGKPTCVFHFDPQSDRVDFWFSINNCRQYECWSAGWLPGAQINAPAPQPPTCETFRERMKEAGLGQETTCFPSSQRCTTVIKNIEGLGDVQVWAQWQGSQKVNTICERKDGELSCGFPYDTNSDRVDYWIRLGDCEESLGYSDGWLEKTEPEAEPLNNEPATNCCQVVKNEAPVYFRDPPKVGTLYLGFGLNCEQPWDFDPNTCATFDAYVGANRDIFWTNGECCIDAESPYFLGCKAPIKDQKKSATKIELRYGECMWDFEFQSPYEAPQESCDGTPCGNTCCAAGCVCDCWEGVCSCSC